MKTRAPLSIALTLSLGIAGCASTPKSLPDPPPSKTSAKDKTSVNTGEKAPEKTNSPEFRMAEPPRFSDTIKDSDGPKKREKDPFALMTCSNADEVRTIAVASKEDGCEVLYEKNGKSNVPAYTAHGTQHCLNSRDKIRDRLVGAGWKCQQ